LHQKYCPNPAKLLIPEACFTKDFRRVPSDVELPLPDRIFTQSAAVAVDQPVPTGN
jgi:hypothetical protein